MSTATTEAPGALGTNIPRIDGPLKVSGAAKYASDHHFPEMVYAVPVCSTVGKGKIASLDASAAEAMPGVVAIFHHGNIGELYRPGPDPSFVAYQDEKRPPFDDETIRYYGQYLAAIAAETFEEASAAAAAVKVTYSAEKPDVSTRFGLDGLSTSSERGDVEQAFAGAAITVDETYSTPTETHNAIELHGTIALWDGENFTLHESTQGVFNHRNVMAQVLGVEPANVNVVARFLGSGFGGKLFPWAHSTLAAAMARKLNRPVKLVVSRKMSFESVGHRPRTEQHIRIGAAADGKLVSFEHDYQNHTSILDDYKEDCGEATPHMYRVPNLRVRSGLVRRNVGTPTAMRGPGAVPGLFATESAMDELAIKLKMDPVELRLKNEPEKDEGLNLPFSSRHLKECLTLGAEKFGWAKRTAEVGSMRRDGRVLGWSVAACSWIAERFPCQASVALKPDGTVQVACGTQDIGTGTYTVLAQVVSAETGIALDKIEVVLGDTKLPPGPISGGSMVTASMIPPVLEAVRAAMQIIVQVATTTAGSPFNGKKPNELKFSAGRVHANEKAPESGIVFSELMRMAKLSAARAQGKADGTFGNPKREYSTHSFGAHFVEVSWRPEIARLRVERVVTVIDAGQILNLGPARNQIEGAIVMGLGMTLFEKTNYDPRNGMPTNSNLADYLVPTNADTPEMDVRFLHYPDKVINELGARGVGEIGLAGIAAAITGAVYHATGIRVRDLPVHVEHLLGK